ncbi:MAG: hypothetical protein PHW60_03885 [Kiritimatiellae bacterium]|nr:hypothetical protein [Kiritimatiellia bacterium]
MLTLTPKQNIAWVSHLERSELRRCLFYGGARSGKTDVIIAWLCVQAAAYHEPATAGALSNPIAMGLKVENVMSEMRVLRIDF